MIDLPAQSQTTQATQSASNSHPRLLKNVSAGHIQEPPSGSHVAGPSLSIIACGNDLRQDDGAGLALARRLADANPHAGLAVELICVHQLTPELALAVARPEVVGVIFVDARVADGAEAGIDMQSLDLAPSVGRLGHHVDAQMVLLYARELYAKQVAAWLITIPGYAFDHGEGFSPRVQALLAGADGFIAQFWGQIGQKWNADDADWADVR